MRFLGVVVAVVLLVAGCAEKPPILSLPSTSGAPTPRRVVVIGDSYTEGSDEGGQGINGWPALVWADLKSQHIAVNPTVSGEGDAGYVTRGYLGHTFGENARNVTTSSADLVVFFGGSNDYQQDPNHLRAAALGAFTQTQTIAPAATLMVIGPVSPGPIPSPEILRVRKILREETQSVGGVFVDPITEGWLADTPELIGSDGVHPPDGGHRYLAARIGPLIRNALNDKTALPTPTP